MKTEKTVTQAEEKKQSMEKLVVTRYQSLVEYMRKMELIKEDTKVLSHANINDVKGKHVLGVMPYWLACHAGKFTEIQLRVPSERKGKELTLEEVEFYSMEPKTYKVTEVPFED